MGDNLRPNGFFQVPQNLVPQTPQILPPEFIFHFHDDEANGTSITITDPATNVILWTITDPHFGFYHQSGEHRMAALNQNLISLLKQLNNIPLTPAETSALH